MIYAAAFFIGQKVESLRTEQDRAASPAKIRIGLGGANLEETEAGSGDVFE